MEAAILIMKKSLKISKG